MTRINSIWLMILTFGIMACEVTQLDQPGDEEEIEMIQEPTALPSSAEELESTFHGGDQRTWQTVSFTFMGVGGIQDCRLDDRMTVKEDGTYEYDGGANLCGAEDVQRIRTGTWTVTNNGRNIVFDLGTVNEYTADVTGLEENIIAISGQYIGLPIRGIYQIN